MVLFQIHVFPVHFAIIRLGLVYDCLDSRAIVVLPIIILLIRCCSCGCWSGRRLRYGMINDIVDLALLQRWWLFVSGRGCLGEHFAENVRHPVA